MKKRNRIMTNIICLLLAVIMLNILPVQAEAAAMAGTNIKKLIKQMDNAELSILSSGNGISQSRVIKLSKACMARLAAVSLKVSDSDGIKKGEFGGYVEYRISDSKLKKKTLDLFGKSLGKKNITSGQQSYFVDAFKTSEPIIYWTDGETDIDYAVRKISIGKTGKTYTIKKKIYYGHWGSNDGKTSNYQFVYTVKKNKKSSYGYVIKSMKVKPLKN